MEERNESTKEENENQDNIEENLVESFEISSEMIKKEESEAKKTEMNEQDEEKKEGEKQEKTDPIIINKNTIVENNEKKRNVLEEIAFEKVEAIMNKLNENGKDVDLSRYEERINWSDDDGDSVNSIRNDQLSKSDENSIGTVIFFDDHEKERKSIIEEKKIIEDEDHTKKNVSSDIVSSDNVNITISQLSPIRRRRTRERSKSFKKFSKVSARYLEPTQSIPIKPKSKEEIEEEEKMKSLRYRKNERFVSGNSLKILEGRNRTPLYKQQLVVDKTRRDSIIVNREKKKSKFVKPHKRRRRSQSAFIPRRTFKLRSNTPNKRILKPRDKTPTRREIIEEKRNKMKAKMMKKQRKIPISATKKKFKHVKSKTIEFLKNKENFLANKNSKRFTLKEKFEHDRTERLKALARHKLAMKSFMKQMDKKQKERKKTIKSRFMNIPEKYTPRKNQEYKEIKDMKKREGVVVPKSRRFNWTDPNLNLKVPKRWSSVKSRVYSYSAKKNDFGFEKPRKIERKKKDDGIEKLIEKMRMRFSKTMTLTSEDLYGKKNNKRSLTPTRGRSFLSMTTGSKPERTTSEKKRLRQRVAKVRELRNKREKKLAEKKVVSRMLDFGKYNNEDEKEILRIRQRLQMRKKIDKKIIDDKISKWTEQI